MVDDLFEKKDILSQLRMGHYRIPEEKYEMVAEQITNGLTSADLSSTFFDAYWDEVDSLIENWKSCHPDEWR